MRIELCSNRITKFFRIILKLDYFACDRIQKSVAGVFAMVDQPTVFTVLFWHPDPEGQW